MYLKKLNQEERKNFLELVYKVANADADYAKSEIDLLKDVKAELEMDYVPSDSTVENLIEEFSKSTMEIRKIVTFGLIRMVMVDGRIKNTEREIVDKMQICFGMSDDEKMALIEAALKLEEAFSEVEKLLS